MNKNERRRASHLLRLEKAKNRIQKGELLKIPYPTTKSEAEIQAELWFKLKEKGFHCRLEVNAASSAFCRFDIVVFNVKGRDIIIEVKKRLEKVLHAKQRDKYLLFDAELIYCYGQKDINLVVEKITKLHIG